MAGTLKVALVGGPMYDGLYARLPKFEKATGLRVEIGFIGDHPALNEHLAEHGCVYDLVSTHSKYAPSQAAFLRPLDGLISGTELERFTSAAVELMRYNGELLQLPRVIDSKIMLYRRDLFANTRQGRELKPPRTWDELVETATLLHHNDEHAGFVFPGKESGLFGHFYEILESAGGQLFTPDLEPAFAGPAGLYALEVLSKLYRQAAPESVVNWHYDAVAQHFLSGKAAITTDWPGAYHAYRQSPVVGDVFGVAPYPAGPAGLRRVYSGGHSFALTAGTRDLPAALELLRFLVSDESQTHEARLGSIVPSIMAMQAVHAETPAGSREALRLEILSAAMRDCMAIPPKFPAYPACEDALWEAVRKVMMGALAPQMALEQAALSVRRIIQAANH